MQAVNNYSLLEIIVKAIPETLIFAFGIFTLTKIKIQSNAKAYFLLFLTQFSLTYSLRSLGVSTAVCTSTGLLIVILIHHILTKADLQRTIMSTLILTLILLVCEYANVELLELIYGHAGTQELLSVSRNRLIYSAPSTVFFASIVLTAKQIMYRRSKSRISENRN